MELNWLGPGQWAHIECWSGARRCQTLDVAGEQRGVGRKRRQSRKWRQKRQRRLTKSQFRRRSSGSQTLRRRSLAFRLAIDSAFNSGVGWLFKQKNKNSLRCSISRRSFTQRLVGGWQLPPGLPAIRSALRKSKGLSGCLRMRLGFCWRPGPQQPLTGRGRRFAAAAAALSRPSTAI